MSLLAPLGLAALAIVPVVVAIHLWRIRHRHYELSSTLLWSQVLAQTPLRRPRRLPSRLLLLLLQLAALACGALALARPSWVAAGSHRHLVVAIDTSLAMSATDVAPNRLARARADARAIVDGLAPGDTVTLVDAGTSPRVLAMTDNHDALIQALGKLLQGYGPSSLAADGPLLEGLIRSYIPAGQSGSAAYLFAPYGLDRGAIAELRRAAPGLQNREVGTTAADVGIAGLSVSCTTAGCEAFARLINTSDRAASTRLTAQVDTAGLAPQSITLPPQSALPVGLALPAGFARAAHTIEMHVDGHDALPLDDTAWAALPLPTHRTALLVTDDPSSALVQALHAIPSLRLQITTPDNYDDAETRNVDLTILDPEGADAAGSGGPWAGIMPPGNLFVVDPTSSDALVTVVGTQQQPGVAIDDVSNAGAGSGSLASSGAPANLLQGVDLDSLVVSSAGVARLPSWAHVDVEGDAGPLLFSGITGGRRVAMLMFDPRASSDTNASNLDTLLAFPTLLENVVDVLAPAPSSDVTAGRITAVPVSRQGATWLVGTASGVHASSPRPVPSSGDLAALPALQPGIYRLGGGPGDTALPLVASAAVPADDAASAPPDEQAPPGGPIVLAPSVLTPWEGWAAIALLALALLSGEWWYYVRHT